MFLSQAGVSRLLNVHSYSSSTIIPQLPSDMPPHFSLSNAGVLGLLDGENAVSAMAAAHVYGDRRWLGWYNTPGSFQIAKQLSSFARTASVNSVQSKSLLSSVDLDPATLFQSGVSKGPTYRAAHSGTVMEETSYLASLFMKENSAWDSEGKVLPGRTTQPIRITIAKLGQAPTSEMHPVHSSSFTLISASIPIIVSVGASTVCAIYEDLWASSLILAGIVANGISCFVLGSAHLVFTHPEPAKGSPAGDGILGSDRDIVLLKGTEGAVNSITRGSFSIRFPNKVHLHLLWWCSVLFFVQCIAQLLLIPQASLFGQVMFIISLGVSWLYNAWLSSSEKEKSDRKMLFERVLENPTLNRYTLGTRTSAVVFMLLVLRPQDPTRLLDQLLPNDTKVWKQWKALVLKELCHPNGQSLFQGKVGRLDGFTEQEQGLLELLYEDARVAYNGFIDYLGISSL